MMFALGLGFPRIWLQCMLIEGHVQIFNQAPDLYRHSFRTQSPFRQHSVHTALRTDEPVFKCHDKLWHFLVSKHHSGTIDGQRIPCVVRILKENFQYLLDLHASPVEVTQVDDSNFLTKAVIHQPEHCRIHNFLGQGLFGYSALCQQIAHVCIMLNACECRVVNTLQHLS